MTGEIGKGEFSRADMMVQTWRALDKHPESIEGDQVANLLFDAAVDAADGYRLTYVVRGKKGVSQEQTGVRASIYTANRDILHAVYPDQPWPQLIWAEVLSREANRGFVRRTNGIRNQERLSSRVAYGSRNLLAGRKESLEELLPGLNEAPALNEPTDVPQDLSGDRTAQVVYANLDNSGLIRSLHSIQDIYPNVNWSRRMSPPGR